MTGHALLRPTPSSSPRHYKHFWLPFAWRRAGEYDAAGRRRRQRVMIRLFAMQPARDADAMMPTGQLMTGRAAVHRRPPSSTLCAYARVLLR